MALSHPSISAAQCRGARAMLGWNQVELAEKAQLARQTVVDFERGARTPHPNNIAALRSALEAAGVGFMPDEGEGEGIRLKARGE